MSELENNLLFWFYCKRCRLYADGVCDAAACLHAPEIVDSVVMSAFDQCFRAKEDEDDVSGIETGGIEEDFCYDDDNSECERDFNVNYCKGCYDYNRCYDDFCAYEAYKNDPEYYDVQKYLCDMAELLGEYIMGIPDDDLPF